MKKLQQATTIGQSNILHDQWLYSTLHNATTVAVFGVTTDLLVSGACVYGHNPYGKDIKRRLINHFTSITGYSPSVKSFTSYPRFEPIYVDWLTQELAELSNPNSAMPVNPSLDGVEDHVILLGDTIEARASASLFNSPYTRELPANVMAQFDKGQVIKQTSNQSLFSHNSTSYRATTLPPDSAEIFVKKTRYAADELEGAKMALEFFPRITVSRLADSGELLYPYFRGESQSDTRLAYIKGGRKDTKLLDSILHVELVEAQDTLCAYRWSLSLTPNDPDRRQKIQRLFHDRLLNDRRMRDFYEQGITLGGETFSFDRLLSLRWVINIEAYPSLREAFDEAKNIVAPGSKQMASPTVFGLGDAHSGNVMSQSLEDSHDVRWIDYEVAGFYPVMLDIAKPIYNTISLQSGLTRYRSLISNNA